MINSRKILTGLVVVSILALCFVWPIPNGYLPFHRNGLIYPLVFVVIGLFLKTPALRLSIASPPVKRILLFIWLFTLFILVNGLIMAPDIKEMLGAWDGQWVRPVLLFTMGLLLLPVIQAQYPSMSAGKLFSLVVLFFWGVIFIHLLDSIYLYWRDGIIHWGETRIVFNRSRLSFQINMITAFLLAELMARALLHKRFLTLKSPILAFMILVNLICTALVDTRWGTIGLIGSFASVFVLIGFNRLRNGEIKKVAAIFGILVCFAIVLGYASWEKDTRWHSLKADAEAGWNAPFTSFCYNVTSGNIPINEVGSPMNHSNGCRASFFHQGWKLVAEHPFGIGPRKLAFNYILRHDTHDNRIDIPHSHYGLIEFGLQNGVIGIAGWLVLLAMTWSIGWKSFRGSNMMQGMFLLLFSVGFFSRTLVDHNLVDHFIEQYMMLIGLLIGCCVVAPISTHKASSDVK